MKLKILLFLLITSSSLIAQDNRQQLLTLEAHYGFNANAYTSDDIAKPFLDYGLGRNFGMKASAILPFRNKKFFAFSGSWSAISQALSTANLAYEFGSDRDSDCCFKSTSFLAFAFGLKYGTTIYKKGALEILGGTGVDFNVDIYSGSTGITIGSRRYWESFDNKTGPAFFVSLDLFTRLNYYLTDKLIITSSLSIVHSPFYALDFTYS